MGQIHYSFDPLRDYEIKDLFTVLNKFYPYIPDDPKKLENMTVGSDPEKDRTIQDLREEIKVRQRDADKQTKEIETLTSKLQETERLLKISEDDNKQGKEELNKLQENFSLKEQELNQSFTAELTKVKTEKEKEIAKLNKDIAELSKRISIYEPSIIGDTGENKFFNIEGSYLNETLSKDAPIVGKVGLNGMAMYQFNVEKGPHKTFSQNTAELGNFFEVIEQIDGSNHISIGEWGTAKFNNNGTMSVITKAKIKLTRE